MVKAIHNLMMNNIDTEIEFNHEGFTFTFINIKNDKHIKTLKSITYEGMSVKVEEFAKQVLK